MAARTDGATDAVAWSNGAGVGDPRWSLVGALVLLLVILAVGLGICLDKITEPRQQLAGSNTRVAASGAAVVIQPGTARCQGGEQVPSDAETMRFFVDYPTGVPTAEPSWSISILQGTESRALTRPANPVQTGAIEIPLPRAARGIAPADICVRNDGATEVAFAGNLSPLSHDAVIGFNLPGGRGTDEVRIDYLRRGRASLWDMRTEVARRFNLVKGSAARSVSLGGALALLFLSVSLAVATLLRGGRWRSTLGLPKAAAAVGVVMFLNAMTWAIVTPTLQVPDETVHIGYSQYLGATGSLPPVRGDEAYADPRLQAMSEGSEYTAIMRGIPFSVEGDPTWSEQADRDLRRRLASNLVQADPFAPGPLAASPPLYYALEAVVFRLTSHLNMLDRVFFMRLLSALMAAGTAIFVFLFTREVLPSTRHAPAIAGLVVAFQPMVGFLAGGVSNDNLMFLCASALFFVLARAFHRGLTFRLGLAAGAALALGDLTKGRMLLLAPGVAVGLVLLAYRDWRSKRPKPVLGWAGFTVAFVGVELPWLVLARLLPERRTGAERLASGVAGSGTFSGKVSYIWQWFLPTLPFMTDAFPAYPNYGVWDVYIQGFIGRFGWFQYGFATTANRVALGVYVVILFLAFGALLSRLPSVRARWTELLTYLVIVGSLLVLIGAASYDYRTSTTFNLEQARYLFPCLALYGGGVAVACRAFRDRWYLPAGAAFVGLTMVHHAYALLLTVERYYT